MLTPVDSVDLTVDYYRIDIDDRIVFSGNFTGAARIAALLAPLRRHRRARFFTNAIDTQTNGLRPHRRPTAWTWARPAPCGSSAGYNQNETEIVGTVADAGRSWPASESVLFDREQTLPRRRAGSRRTTCA